MLRSRLGVLALLLALLAAPAAAVPRISGKILNPPQDAQIELRPWAIEHAEALRRLRGEAIPPIASAGPLPDGSFALQVPEPGFYSVALRAPGHVPMERFVRFVVEETEVPPVELAPASPLEVTAVGAAGLPLAGVTIQALPLQAENGEWRAAERRGITDAAGKTVFLRAAGEALRLFVTTPGLYATASTGPAEAPQTVRFVAEPIRMVQFRNPDGKPAAGALVRLFRRGWPYGLTGEDGRIALPAPPEGETGLFAEDSRGRWAEVVLGVLSQGPEAPVATLRPRAMASGRVLDASSREPVAGALVWNGGTGWARTGAEGRFEVAAPAGDRRWLEATAAGRMLHVETWEKDRSAPATFLLEAAANISGQVVDEEGLPVEGARVTTVVNNGESRSLRMEGRGAASGADGRFVLRRLPAGRLHAIEAVREGLAPGRQLADSTAPVRIVLRRGALAAGRIVDEEGLPVSGARAVLHPLGEGGVPSRYQPFEATSDPEGRVQFQRVSAGRFSLRVESQGFVAAVVENVAIPEQETEADLGEIRLLAGGAIEGIVTDERGRPVEKAWVDLSPAGDEDFMTAANAISGRRPAETGADGRFRIENLPRGAHFDVEADHEELQPGEVLGVEVPTAEPLRIRLSRPRTLSGRVVDELGGPIAGASVSSSVRTESPNGVMSRSRGEGRGTTDSEGRFRLSSVPPGAVHIHAKAPGYRSREVLVQVPEEGEAEPVEIALGPGTSLEGRVLDAQGLPVSRARMELRAGDAEQRTFLSGGMTDGEGRYEMTDLQPGPGEVLAFLDQKGRVARGIVEIRPGRNRLDLKFTGGAEVSGRVFDSRGEPLAGVGLSLEAVQRELFAWPLQALSAADGSFTLADVADGEYRLVASRSGFGPARYPGEIRVDGAPVTGLELRLFPGAVIRGRILGLQPDEMREATVLAFSEGLGVPLLGTVLPGPAYRIADVAPGEWHVVAQISPQITAEGKVEVAAGAEEAVLDLELPPGFTLTGRVFLDREPLPAAELVAASVEGKAWRAGRAGQDGSFRLVHLPPGNYVLSATLAQGSIHYQTLEIEADLDVAVEISTGAVEGRLLSPEGLPVAGAAVALVREIPELQATVPGAGTTSDERGAFEMLRVPAGTYRMTVQAEGFEPAESRVVVAPGGTVRLEMALGVYP